MQQTRNIDAPQPKSSLENEFSGFPRVIMILGKMPELPIEGQTLYRGDAQDFNYTFNNGFKARGTNTDLLLHMNSVGEDFLHDSAYIATSLSKEIAQKFPDPQLSETNPTYVYEIHTKRPTIDVAHEIAKILDTQTSIEPEDFERYKLEQERAVHSKIQPNEIKGCWEVVNNKILVENPEDVIRQFSERNISLTREQLEEMCHEYTRTMKEKFIANPNYVPPISPGVRVWNAAWIGVRYTGHALTGIAAIMDGTSLYREVTTSQQSGDYNNTYREANRIINGWSGAITMGSFLLRRVLLPALLWSLLGHQPVPLSVAYRVLLLAITVAALC